MPSFHTALCMAHDEPELTEERHTPEDKSEMAKSAEACGLWQ